MQPSLDDTRLHAEKEMARLIEEVAVANDVTYEQAAAHLQWRAGGSPPQKRPSGELGMNRHQRRRQAALMRRGRRRR